MTSAGGVLMCFLDMEKNIDATHFIETLYNNALSLFIDDFGFEGIDTEELRNNLDQMLYNVEEEYGRLYCTILVHVRWVLQSHGVRWKEYTRRMRSMTSMVIPCAGCRGRGLEMWRCSRYTCPVAAPCCNISQPELHYMKSLRAMETCVLEEAQKINAPESALVSTEDLIEICKARIKARREKK